VVEHLDRRIITAAGVSSGIDMAIRLVELLVDEVGAKAAQLMVEYDPQPPFDAGHPDRADGAVLDRVRQWAAQRLPAYELTEGPLDLTDDGPPTTVGLAELFGGHDELVVYHLMLHPDDDDACPMCSLWVDGLHGVAHHLARRAGFAVIAKAPIDKLRAWARRRGWQGLRIVSAFNTSFATDLHVEGSKGGQFPAVSVFLRDGDVIRHVLTQSADFPDGRGRGIDLLSPVWNVLDLLPSGRGDWLPATPTPAPAAEPSPTIADNAALRGGGWSALRSVRDSLRMDVPERPRDRTRSRPSVG